MAAFGNDTFLKRAGGSLAEFTGSVLRDIELSDFARRANFVALFITFLKSIKEAGYAPEDAQTLVETFLSFEGTPQVITGGQLEVGGQIRNVRETELGLDVAIEFSAPAIPFAGGLEAGLDLGFGYRREDKESTAQNFRAVIRWMRASGPVKLPQEALVKAAESVLAATDIAWPEVTEEGVNDSSDLLNSAIIPFLTGLVAKD